MCFFMGNNNFILKIVLGRWEGSNNFININFFWFINYLFRCFIVIGIVCCVLIVFYVLFFFEIYKVNGYYFVLWSIFMVKWI